MSHFTVRAADFSGLFWQSVWCTHDRLHLEPEYQSFRTPKPDSREQPSLSWIFRKIFRRQHKTWDKLHGGLFWSAVQLGLGLIQSFLQGFPWIWSQQPWLQEPKAQEQFKALPQEPVCALAVTEACPGPGAVSIPNPSKHGPPLS